MGLCNVGRSYNGCIDRLCHVFFLYSVWRIAGQPETKWSTVSSYWSHILHFLLVIPGVVALVLCNHDKSFYVSFQTHTIKPLMGVFLINISLLNSMWVLVMQRFIFPSLLLLSLWWLLLLLLLLLLFYYYYYYCCFSKSFKANIPIIWKPVGWFVLQINWLSYDGNMDLKWVNRFILNAVWESFCIFVSAILVNLRLIAMFIKTRLLLTCKK